MLNIAAFSRHRAGTPSLLQAQQRAQPKSSSRAPAAPLTYQAQMDAIFYVWDPTPSAGPANSSTRAWTQSTRDRPMGCSTPGCMARFFSHAELMAHKRDGAVHPSYECIHCAERATNATVQVKYFPRKDKTGVDICYVCSKCDGKYYWRRTAGQT